MSVGLSTMPRIERSGRSCRPLHPSLTAHPQHIPDTVNSEMDQVTLFKVLKASRSERSNSMDIGKTAGPSGWNTLAGLAGLTSSRIKILTSRWPKSKSRKKETEDRPPSKFPNSAKIPRTHRSQGRSARGRPAASRRRSDQPKDSNIMITMLRHTCCAGLFSRSERHTGRAKWRLCHRHGASRRTEWRPEKAIPALP